MALKQILFSVLLLFLFGPIAWSENLLAEDDFSFEFDETMLETRSWLDDSRFTIQQSLSQGKRLDLFRTEARFEYESAPWEGAYVKVDHKLSYFAHNDRLARQRQEDYLNNKLQQAWFQLSEQDCFVKIGRQNLFWGSVEGTFANDVVTPFDYTEPLLTDFTSIRSSENLIDTQCFWGQQQLQVFLTPRASIDLISHHPESDWSALEDQLNEEWGLRFIQSREGFDVHVMYARLYGNTPVPVLIGGFPPSAELRTSRFDFVGLSLVKAMGRLLLELDAAYKSDQIEAYTGATEDLWEFATGFEYTTANNHSINAGIWMFHAQPTQLGGSVINAQAWTMGWSKAYWNDDLSMSFLASYASEPKQSQATLQGQYQWNDYWNVACALGYADYDAASDFGESGWQLTSQIKWQI